MEKKVVIKIELIIDRSYTNLAIDLLTSNGISNIFIEAGRNSILEEKRSFFSAVRMVISNDPADIIFFFVPMSRELAVLKFLEEKLELQTAGRGSIFSVAVTMNNAECLKLLEEEVVSNSSSNYNSMLYSELNGICCIVQRDYGDNISKVALEAGASVPVTTYGLGGGIRDKLGLLRITIPPEKEIINLVMSKYDLDAVMEMMIIEGKLNLPGKGFIYEYPVRHGLLNPKISRGSTGQVATIEQIISAIDSIKGNMEWRKSKIGQESYRDLNYLKGLIELNLICNEGFAFELTKVAIENGASGATISYFKQLDGLSGTLSAIENCKMVIPGESLPRILEALTNFGAFNEEVSALLFSSAVFKAYTYLAAKSSAKKVISSSIKK